MRLPRRRASRAGLITALAASFLATATAGSPSPHPPPSVSAAADGFASVAALGQDGTTGGAGGAVVTAATTAEFLDHLSRPGPLVVQVSGTITLPAGSSDGMHPVASAMDAGVVLEGNYFHSVNNPARVDFSGGLGRLVARDNILVECNHPVETRGPGAEPRTYHSYTPHRAAEVPAVVPAGAGAGRT